MKWFKNTLFVLTADHATVSDFPEYQTDCGYMSIPIAFYHGGDSLMPSVYNTISQQTDIMPSVLSYLHYNGPVTSFGKSIFTETNSHFAANYNNGGFQWLQDQYLLQYDGKKTTGLFDYVNDRLLKKNLRDQMPMKRDSLEIKMKAFIQQYHNRLTEDKLWPG
jgi:hypothetical protein